MEYIQNIKGLEINNNNLSEPSKEEDSIKKSSDNERDMNDDFRNKIEDEANQEPNSITGKYANFTKNSKKQKNSNQFIRNGILGKSIVKEYISGELSLQNMQNTLKRQKSINATNNNGLKDNIKLFK